MQSWIFSSLRLLVSILSCELLWTPLIDKGQRRQGKSYNYHTEKMIKHLLWFWDGLCSGRDSERYSSCLHKVLAVFSQQFQFFPSLWIIEDFYLMIGWKSLSKFGVQAAIISNKYYCSRVTDYKMNNYSLTISLLLFLNLWKVRFFSVFI